MVADMTRRRLTQRCGMPVLASSRGRLICRDPGADLELHGGPFSPWTATEAPRDVFLALNRGFAMMPEVDYTQASFQDRRQSEASERPNLERRQFADAHSELSQEARELAMAIDNYKRLHRRRFITHEEMVAVIKSIGYHK